MREHPVLNEGFANQKVQIIVCTGVGSPTFWPAQTVVPAILAVKMHI